MLMIPQPSLLDPARIDAALFHSLDELVADAAGALDRERQARPYDRLEWLRLTQAHILPHTPFVAARARVGDDGAWLFLQDRSGGHARAFASWYTLNLAPVFARDSSIAVQSQLVGAVAQLLRGTFDRIDLWPLDDATAPLVGDAFRQAGWWVARTDYAPNWTTATKDLTFEQYWAARPSRLRNTVRRKLKSRELVTRVFDRFDEEAWAHYETVYAGSWKPVEGAPAFVRALARAEGEAGCLRLGLAYRDGQPIAGQFWTVERDVAVIHKLAYLESERASSPGTVLSHAMFQHVIDQDRPALIDFGIGDEAYKMDWMTDRRPMHRLSLFNARSAGGIARAAGAAVAALARNVRHGG